jgi:hypothetical protein
MKRKELTKLKPSQVFFRPVVTSDLVLVMEDTEFYVHKVPLSIACGYFNALLEAKGAPDSTP